jgi:chemotaxis protein methyltransferase CheR
MNDTEYLLIKKKLQTLTSINLESYKSAQMRRRLDGYLERVHGRTWAEFLHKLDGDPTAVRNLRDFITINVSNFFRDRHKWVELQTKVLPIAVKKGQPLRVWSAACSIGAEAYSLAIMFQENKSFANYQIVGTDIDRDALEKARAGGPYSADDFREMDPHLVEKYFRHDGKGYWAQPILRSHVTFTEKDLLRSIVREEFDLVVCRNVLIYFTEEAKIQVVTGLVHALKPGGILFIGATEGIPSGQFPNLERISLSFYKRTA